MKAWFDWLDAGVRRHDKQTYPSAVIPADAGIQLSWPSNRFSGA
jgi:hypothetical protein